MDSIIFDKTGTLTTGELKVIEIKNNTVLSEGDFLSIIYSLEKNTDHPIAKSIVNFCKEKSAVKNEMIFDRTSTFENLINSSI